MPSYGAQRHAVAARPSAVPGNGGIVVNHAAGRGYANGKPVVASVAFVSPHTGMALRRCCLRNTMIYADGIR